MNTALSDYDIMLLIFHCISSVIKPVFSFQTSTESATNINPPTPKPIAAIVGTTAAVLIVIMLAVVIIIKIKRSR